MPTGIYISVPFCKQKCSFCNFASGVFSRHLMQRYVERVCDDISHVGSTAASLGGALDRSVDTVYFGGGTPTTLAPEQLSQLFSAVRNVFDVATDAETTVECAPGTLSPAILDGLVSNGVNRVSLGVQSFIEAEAAQSVACITAKSFSPRLIVSAPPAFTTSILTSSQVSRIRPFQVGASRWTSAAASGVPHISVYMLEVDEDSRLGREVMAGGVRYPRA